MRAEESPADGPRRDDRARGRWIGRPGSGDAQAELVTDLCMCSDGAIQALGTPARSRYMPGRKLEVKDVRFDHRRGTKVIAAPAWAYERVPESDAYRMTLDSMRIITDEVQS